MGLSNSGLPASILANLRAEEDLEAIISVEDGDRVTTERTSGNECISDVESRPVEQSSDDEGAGVLQVGGEVSFDDDVQPDGDVGSSAASSSRGNVEAYSGCVDEGDIMRERAGAYEGMVRQANKMGDKVRDLPALEVGTSVVMAMPKVDRGPLDPANIHAVITDKKNDVYQLGTSAGTIKGWFPRSALRETNCGNTGEDGAVGTDRIVGLREAFRQQSLFGGQGMRQCSCRASAKHCTNNRCKCRKGGVLCTSRCHMSLPCVNK